MRGKVFASPPAMLLTGITPAYAGKSATAKRQTHVQRDHPRVCGEKTAATINELRQAGSPPRMRGKVTCVPRCCLTCGITPAYAGKRRGWSKWQISSRGSPPRMRGKVFSVALDFLVSGITPAYAGKSRIFIVNNKSDRDHPRVCGEKAGYKPPCIGV